MSINVTKAYLPPIDEYEHYVEQIWQSGILTNQGPLLKEFEARINNYLGADSFQFVANGTLALQLALRALVPAGSEVITTPFTYVASTSAIMWEGLSPVFVDIKPQTLCIDPDLIEAAITTKTKAILAVHVFGLPCDVDAIHEIAKKHNLKVIYDGAHAFGVQYEGKSLLSYGDIATCSFHATKLFHTIEGGGLIVQDTEAAQAIELKKRFGHQGDEHKTLGINAKASEFQAAMGLTNLKHIDEIIAARGVVVQAYDKLLEGSKTVVIPKKPKGWNNAYYPVVFESEEALLRAQNAMNEVDVFPRRYFWPSLNELPYVKNPNHCPRSEDIARRVLCLPLYPELDEKDIKIVTDTILRTGHD